MKLMKFLILLFILFGCDSYEMKGHEACMEVKKTIGSQCDYKGEFLVFSQNSVYGNTVKFTKKNREQLKIECHNFRVGIDLNRLPKLNFKNVTEIELKKCSLSNSTLLSSIKTSFNIKNVKKLIITATNEQHAVNMTDFFFKNLSELETLELTSNFHINYNNDTFKSLNSLKVLKLQVYDIIALPSDIFVPLDKVENLVLSSSGSLKSEAKKFNIILNKCLYMNTFTLIGIRWLIQIETLVNSVGMTNVVVKNNRFDSEISSRAFEKASNIEKLSLINNSIVSLPKDIFAWQTSMNVINLSFNKISDLHQDIFIRAKFLSTIDLSHNNLYYVSGNLFLNLIQLTRLDLSHNRLKQIGFEANIGKLNSLKLLDLSYNQVEKLVGNLSCPNLLTLELSHNNFKRIFVDQIWDFSKRNLTVNLMENMLESIDFRDLEYRENSTTTGKLLINVDKEIICNCHTMSLYNFTKKDLNIHPKLYDAIKVFPKDIKCIKQTADTPQSVSDIQIKFITCPLNFPHQKICPDACNCTRRPYDGFLIVRCTNIAEVPPMPPFKILNDIKLDKIELSVTANGIKSLPSKQYDINYNDVTIIYASHNSIQKISADNIPDRLQILDLKFNRLSHISSDVISKFTSLRRLHLSNNPWDCSEAKDLVKFVKRYRDIEKDFNMVQCSSYKYFLEVETEDQCKGKFANIIVLFIAATFIFALLTVYYVKRAAITEWIFVKDRRNLLERTFDLIKLFDGIVCVANQDLVFGKYIAAKLLERPNQFKISMIAKDWASNDAIPKNVLKGFRNSRRVIVVLSEYLKENDWTRWNYFNTNTRIIFIVKSTKTVDDIGISNAMLIKFGDPWFWDKLKHAMVHQKELTFDDYQGDVEMQPLRNLTVNSL